MANWRLRLLPTGSISFALLFVFAIGMNTPGSPPDSNTPEAAPATRLVEANSGAGDNAQIQTAIDRLTPNRTWIETIKVKGTFQLYDTVIIPSYTRLDLTEAELVLAPSTAKTMLQNSDFDGNTQIHILGGILDGNKEKQPDDRKVRYGLFFYKVSDSSIRDLEVKNVKSSANEDRANGEGIRISGRGDKSTRNFTLDNIRTHDNANSGIRVMWGMRAVRYNNIFAYNNGADGIVFDHSEAEAVNIYAHKNGRYGIRIRNVLGCTFTNFTATKNRQHGIFVQGMVASQGMNWKSQNNGKLKKKTYDDIFFSGDASESYGVTNSTLITGVWAGGARHHGPVKERYAIYFEDEVNGNVRLLNVYYGSAMAGQIKLPSPVNNLIVMDVPDGPYLRMAAGKLLTDEQGWSEERLW